jgi:hypothetical protein
MILCFSRHEGFYSAAAALIVVIAFSSCKDRISSQPLQTSASNAVVAVPSSQTPRQAMPAMTPRPPNTTHTPREGYVPDAATAIKIAEAVWKPMYGEETLKNERPFTAQLVNGVCIVQGTLPKGWDGGTAYAEITKETGRILNVRHFQ